MGSYFDKLQQASKPLVLAFITAIAGLCYFLHLQTDWLLLLLVRLVWGLCLGAMLPMIQALMITFAEESRQGLLIGRAQRNIKIGNLAGVSSGALLLVWWDYQTGFTVAAAVYLLAASVLMMVWSLLNRSYEPVPAER
ncbi:MFS transporter [Aliamphritea spongicola]|nr:MFS transporter [Aliamphritea spongicola]